MAGPSPGRPRRRGFGLAELSAAGVMFAALVFLTVAVVGWVADERRAAGRREAAIRTVGNIMERVLARPWTEVDPATLAPLVDEANRGRAAISGRATIAVGPAEEIGGVGQKRIVVEVAWPDRARTPEAPVRLIAWVYDRKGRP